MPQKVVVVVPEDGSLFEISTPLRVWGDDPGEPDWPAAELVVCGTGGDRTSLATYPLTLGGLERLTDHAPGADMVIVPTWPIDARPVPHPLLEALRSAHAEGARVVGLCLGAFALAEAGLLDGHRAVTHWRYADDFARRYPAVALDRAPLYVDEGSVVTSAGSAAAIDCCLHLVRRDYGADAAALVARSLVTAPHRSGGQSQFAAVAPLSTADDRLGVLLSRAAAEIRDVRSVADLVARSAMSRRSLERLFHDRLGSSPGSWLISQRVQTARQLLEGTDLSVEAVADAVGFGSVQALRREFRRAVAVAPTTYRRAFRAPG
jgi:transcriptional regulator GlxA family with amidase domain